MSSPRISALTTGTSRRAAMQARAKNDMKPSPTPCCCWKRSLYSARSASTALMSISLKVVRMAAVCWACTSRSAMRLRRGVMGTTSSPSDAGGGTGDGAGRGVATAAAGTALGAGVPRSRYASTSSLVRRPPLPVPGMSAGSRSCSVIRRRTAGMSGPTTRLAGAGAGRATGAISTARATGAAATGASAGAAARAGAAAWAACSRRATTSPTATVSPFCRRMRSTPARSAGISRLALSVSSSSSGSSAATRSPSFFSHCTITPSVTDSPRVGMRTSTAIPPLPVSAREGALHQLVLLGRVDLVRARGRARRLGTPDVGELGAVEQRASQAVVDELPGTHVPGFFLHPEDLLRVRVGFEEPPELGLRERVELLDAQEGDRIDRALAAAGQERVIDLAAAQDDAGHATTVEGDTSLRGSVDRDVVEDRMEGPLGELREGRHRELVAEETLRAHDDQRLPEVAVDLTA